MAVIAEGKLAPDFTLESTAGKKVSLSDFRGKKNVVLYFYPKDNTSGCTQEACDFRDGIKKFKASDTEILGVSPDSLSSHDKFLAKFELPFQLLSDDEKKVSSLYGVWKEKSMYGRKYMGIVRSTFVIDKKGMVQKIFSKVKVAGHIDAVLESIKALK